MNPIRLRKLKFRKLEMSDLRPFMRMPAMLQLRSECLCAHIRVAVGIRQPDFHHGIDSVSQQKIRAFELVPPVGDRRIVLRVARVYLHAQGDVICRFPGDGGQNPVF